MNKYLCMYHGKEYEVESDTTYHAQQKLANQLKIKKSYEITVYLTEKKGTAVLHDPGEL